MKEQIALQKTLRSKYQEMRARNPSFSIRAFAKRTGLSPTTLSLILNGKRKVSKKIIQQVSERLVLDPQERSELLGQFPQAKKQKEADESFLQFTADQYQIIADWHSFAILNLIRIKGFRSDPEWIAERLGSTASQVKTCLERLKRLNFVSEDDNGALRRTHNKYRTTDDVQNLSLRASHYQNLDLARKSLDEDDLPLRDFSWTTFPLDRKKMSQAKTLIRKFQDDLYDLLSEDAEPDEVYRLNVQLFPLSRSKEGKS